jgi:hypothetical protein
MIHEMLIWLRGTLHAHPEIAFFLVLGIELPAGKLAFRSFKLGAVTGTLLAGVLVGAARHHGVERGQAVLFSCCSSSRSVSGRARVLSAG